MSVFDTDLVQKDLPLEDILREKITGRVEGVMDAINQKSAHGVIQFKRLTERGTYGVYDIDWIIQRAQNYLSEYLKTETKNSKSICFCQEYLRTRCDSLLRGIWWSSGSTIIIDSVIEHPEECVEYPSIRSYDVKVEYIKRHQIYTFTVYCQYRTGGDLTYKRYVAKFEI